MIFMILGFPCILVFLATQNEYIKNFVWAVMPFYYHVLGLFFVFYFGGTAVDNHTYVN